MTTNTQTHTLMGLPLPCLLGMVDPTGRLVLAGGYLGRPLRDVLANPDRYEWLANLARDCGVVCPALTHLGENGSISRHVPASVGLPRD